MTAALILYFLAVLEDGDHLNDWLTWIPFWAAGPVELVGWGLALALGY